MKRSHLNNLHVATGYLFVLFIYFCANGWMCFSAVLSLQVTSRCAPYSSVMWSPSRTSAQRASPSRSSTCLTPCTPGSTASQTSTMSTRWKQNSCLLITPASGMCRNGWDLWTVWNSNRFRETAWKIFHTSDAFTNVIVYCVLLIV